jgi:hypothetical protein
METGNSGLYFHIKTPEYFTSKMKVSQISMRKERDQKLNKKYECMSTAATQICTKNNYEIR